MVLTMNGLAHLLDNAVYRLQPLIIAIALIVWVAGLVSWVWFQWKFRRKNPWANPGVPRSFIAACIIFAGIIGAEFAFAAIIQQAALNEIKPILSSKVESVTVDGTQISGGDALVDALRKMHGTIGHHSHPTRTYQVILRSSFGSLALDFGRDSQDPHEYWVFYPGFHSTTLNAVGHAFTDALDRIQDN